MKELPVVYNNELVAAVTMLFSPWTLIKPESIVPMPQCEFLFDEKQDYTSKLFKEVRNSFGGVIADAIVYNVINANGNTEQCFVIEVVVTMGSEIFSAVGVSKRKKMAKNAAAYNCLASIREVQFNINAVINSTGNAAQEDLDIVKFKESCDYQVKFKDIVRQMYGKKSSKSIKYQINENTEHRFDCLLSVSVKNKSIPLEFNVYNMHSKKAAMMYVAYKGFCNFSSLRIES